MEIRNGFDVDAPIDHVWAYMLDVTKVAPCMPGAELTETVDETTWKGNVAVRLGPVKMAFAGTVRMTERDDAAHHVVLKADGREQRGRGAASALVTADMAATEGGTRVDFVTDLTITGAAAQYGRGMIQDISAKLTNEFASCLKTNIGAEEAARSSTPQAAPPGLTAPDTAGSTDPATGATAPVTAPATSEEPPATSSTSSPGQAPHAPSTPAPSTPSPAGAPISYVRAKPVKGVRLGLWALWQAFLRFVRRLFGHRG